MEKHNFSQICTDVLQVNYYIIIDFKKIIYNFEHRTKHMLPKQVRKSMEIISTLI